MVPSGWNTLALSEITKEKISYGIVQAGPNVKDGIPYIKSADVCGEIDVDSLQRTAKEIHHKYRRSSVHPNDIVFSLRGNIARTSIVPTSLQEANLTQGTARISVNDKNDTKFVYYKLASTPILNRINALSKGSTFKEISLEELRKVKLALPPLEEQRKIAKILSTWDKAISTTERLIDNSKQQKKALMQQLLTGKKRLLDDSGKPFEGEWEEVLLGNIVDRPICYGVLKPGDHTEGGIPLLRIQDLKGSLLNESQMIRITKELHQEFKRTILREGDLVMSIVGTLGKVLKIPKQLEGANITRAFAVIGIAEHSKDFIKQYLTSDYIQEWLLNTATGNAQKVLNVAAIRKLKINVPAIEEQRKIAIVLGSADKEIELLEQQLADLKLEKKALMQQLLTGKRRVKVDAEAVA